MTLNSIYTTNLNFIGLSADHRNGHQAESIDYELPPRKKFNISGPIYGPALLLLLAACGGGGSGSTAPDILPIPPTDNENGDVAAQGLKTLSQSDKIVITGADKKIEYNDEGLGNDVLLQEAGKDNPKIYTVLEGAGLKEEKYDVYFITGDDENNAELTFAANHGGESHYFLGNDGDDIITGGSKKDWLYGERGSDNLFGGGGDDFLFGGKNDDILQGQGGADMLNGGDGNDSLEGGSGADSLDGGTGNDTASYASSRSGVVVDLSIAPTNNGYIEQEGSGYSAGDKLKRIENITGGDGADTLTGDSAPNILIGNAGKDTLLGGAGKDTLKGGADAVRDTLTGGVGADTFYLSSDSVADEANADLITDFAFGTDLLAFLGKDIWFVLDTSTDPDELVLYADANGADVLAVIQGTNLATLTDANFAVGQKPISVNSITANFTGSDSDYIKTVVELMRADETGVGMPVLPTVAGNFPTVRGGKFMIEAIGDNDVFDVNERTGSVTWKEGTNINHDLKSSYSFKLSYVFGGDALVLASQMVSVSITDINDETPEFANTAIGDVVAGKGYVGGASGDIVYTALAAPDVSTVAVTYSIKAGAGDDVFMIDRTSGVVRFIESATIKDSGTYVFTITATAGRQDMDKIITWTVGPNLASTDMGDTIVGGAGPDKLSGLGGNDMLNGLAGADTLLGGAGADTLLGGAGEDTLDGGADTVRDILTGGDDADTFYLSSVRAATKANADLITDFEFGIDKLAYLGKEIWYVLDTSTEPDELVLYADANGVHILAVIQGMNLPALADAHFADGQKPTSVNLITPRFTDTTIDAPFNELVGTDVTDVNTPMLLGEATGYLPKVTGAKFMIDNTDSTDDHASFVVNPMTGSVKWAVDVIINHEDDKSTYSFTLLYMVEEAVLARQIVNVSIGDVDEAGVVGEIQSFSGTGLPKFDEQLTAPSLEDPEEVVEDSEAYQWDRSVDGSDGSWNPITDNAALVTYTPVAEDAGKFIRVNITYTDEFGGGKIASSPGKQVAANQYPTVLLLTVDGTPSAPNEKTLTENFNYSNLDSPGTPSRIKMADITVTDDGLGDYELVLNNDDTFEIDTEVLYLKAGTVLDFESVNTFMVTVSVKDDDGENNQILLSQTFTLKITDEDDFRQTGTENSDFRYGGAENNLFFTGTNNDELYGGGGDDKLFSGPDDDLIDGGTGNDVMLGEAGADTIDGGEGNDTASYLFSRAAVIVDLTIDADADGYILQVGLSDSVGDKLKSIENITGGRFNDTLTGDMNGNILNGSGGADTLDGGGGADTASYEGFSFDGRDENLTGSVTRGSTVIVDVNATEGIGARTVAIADITGVYVNLSLAVVDRGFILQVSGNGHASGDKLKNIENLTGSNLKDVLVGNGGVNVLTGGAEDDILIGGAGNDTLDGGAGKDTLTGDAGNDIFMVDGDLTVLNLADIITDFTDGEDTINASDVADVSYLTSGTTTIIFSGTTGTPTSSNVLAVLQDYSGDLDASDFALVAGADIAVTSLPDIT